MGRCQVYTWQDARLSEARAERERERKSEIIYKYIEREREKERERKSEIIYKYIERERERETDQFWNSKEKGEER